MKTAIAVYLRLSRSQAEKARSNKPLRCPYCDGLISEGAEYVRLTRNNMLWVWYCSESCTVQAMTKTLREMGEEMISALVESVIDVRMLSPLIPMKKTKDGQLTTQAAA